MDGHRIENLEKSVINTKINNVTEGGDMRVCTSMYVGMYFTRFTMAKGLANPPMARKRSRIICTLLNLSEKLASENQTLIKCTYRACVVGLGY